MLCSVIKPYGQEPKLFRYDKYDCPPAKETRLIDAVIKELSKYDLVVGHNIDRFDWNYLKSRAVVLGVPLGFRPLTYDTLKAFRRIGFLTRSNGFGKPTASLAHIVDGLGIKQEKTSIYPQEHWKAVWADATNKRKALDDISAHCIADTRLTEQVYERLLQMDSNPIIRRVK